MSSRAGWYQWIFQQLDLSESARVLDVGAGSGVFWRVNTDDVPRSWKVTCLDVAPGVARTGRDLDTARTARWCAADAHDLPFDEDAFDGIVALHVLAGARLGQAISELHRVLSPDGSVYATSSGSQHVEAIAEALSIAFDDVEVTPYAGALRVQEIEPLADKLADSWARWPGIEGSSPEETRSRITQVLEGMGTFDAHRDDCLIVARA